MLFLSGVSGSPVSDNDPEKPRDYFKPEQLSPNNSAPNFTQQPSEETPSTTSPIDTTRASEQTDLNAETTTPPTTEPKSTDTHDNPEIPVSESTPKNPQSVFELEQHSPKVPVPTVPPEMVSTRPNSTPTSDHSATTKSQSSSDPKPTPSATAQANNPDLNTFNPVQSEDMQGAEVNLKNQTETQLEPSENTTLGILEITKTVSTAKPTTANIIEDQNENQDTMSVLSTRDSPTFPTIIESTPASVKVSPSPTKSQEIPTKPKEANNNISNDNLQDYQAGKGTRFT